MGLLIIIVLFLVVLEVITEQYLSVILWNSTECFV